MQEKDLMESVEIMQRVLLNLVKGEKAFDNDILKLESFNRLIEREKKEFLTSDENLTKVTTSYLRDLGIPSNIKGYDFLRSAIIIRFKSKSKISMTKELYPSVADIFNTTPSRVERAIRHAIECGWSRGSVEKQEKLFGYSHLSAQCKPSNGLFISSIVDDMNFSL